MHTQQTYIIQFMFMFMFMPCHVMSCHVVMFFFLFMSSPLLSRLPYEYYMLPFCQPDQMETVAENLGEVLRGDKIMNSNYELKMSVEETCKILCRKEMAASDSKLFSTR